MSRISSSKYMQMAYERNTKMGTNMDNIDSKGQANTIRGRERQDGHVGHMSTYCELQVI